MHKPDLTSVDQCVMCGMCQPHCPTYQVNQIESESPRGRLSMISGLAQQQLRADSSVIEHLYNCTGCGACEAMCPSRVPFIQLMDDTKAVVDQQRQQSLAFKILLFLVRHPRRYGLLNTLLRHKPLGSVLRAFNILDKRTAPLQHIAVGSPTYRSFSPFYHAKGKTRGDIGLFTGCISQLFDQTTLLDTITLLTHCGYNVHVSDHQACCGALHQHNAQIDAADQLQQQNLKVFNTKTLDAVIGTSSGCMAQLRSGSSPIAVIDIMQFIADQQLLDQLALGPINAQISVHQPCSHQYQLKLPAINSLIKRIPGAEINSLDDNETCCGAGGINLLLPTNTSEQLKRLKTDAVSQQSPDILVSSNYGCALQIASGLANYRLSQNKEIEICHPVSLLVRSASLK